VGGQNLSAVAELPGDRRRADLLWVHESPGPGTNNHSRLNKHISYPLTQSYSHSSIHRNERSGHSE